jgi:hypothetical protein
MDGKLFGGDYYANLDLPGLEIQLAEVLVPIIPRVDFISDLKKRLIVEPDDSLLVRKQNPIQVILLGFAGVISGVLILLIGFRAIIALLGGKGYLQQIKEQTRQKKAQTLGSVS